MHLPHIFVLGFLGILCCSAHAPWQPPPREIMSEITNDLGVCILQVIAENSKENIAFSPYGLMSVVFLLYEGSQGNTAIEIYNSLRLPWDRHISRIGFRDLHQHIKSYFTNDRFLRGLVLSKPNVPLKVDYVRLLHFYGFYPGPETPPPPIPESKDDPNFPTQGSIPYEPSLTTGTTGLFPDGPSSESPVPEQPSTEPPYTEDDSYTGLFGPQENVTPSEENEIVPDTPSNTKTTPTFFEDHDFSDIFPPEAEKTTTSTVPPDFEENNESTGNDEQDDVIPSTIKIPDGLTTTKIGEEVPNPGFTTIDSGIYFPEGESRATTEKSSTLTPANTAETEDEDTTLDIDVRFGTSPATTIQTSTAAPLSKVVDSKTETMSDEATTPKTTTPPQPVETTPPLTSSNIETTTESEGTMKAQTLKVAEETTTQAPQNVDDKIEAREEPDDVVTTSITPSVESVKEAATTTEKVESAGSTETSKTEVNEEPKDETTETVSTTQSMVETTEMDNLANNTLSDITASNSTETSAETTTDNSNVISNDTRRRRMLKKRRKRRSLPSSQLPVEHREGNINWIPQAQGPHWVYNVPRDQWFFTYSGGEPVPVLTYSDFLPFAFIEGLNAVALQLPLDDVRYSMLVILPVERYGLPQVMGNLHQCPINHILQQLKITPIHAVIPSFTVVKHINLVPSLLQIGVQSLFDPALANLGGMADEAPLFVRSIEQLVTVSLRKYHYNIRRYDHQGPQEVRHHFIANHPFLYFVLDTETNAALMAGTITNPAAYKQSSTP